MHEACGVRFREAFARFEHPASCLLDRQRASLGELGLERRALERFGCDVRHAVFGEADVDDARDMRALQPGRQARLLQASLDELLLIIRVGCKDLHRHRLAEVDVARRDDDPGRASPEELLDAVLARDGLTRPYGEPRNEADAAPFVHPTFTY